jgi:hypothetical protein
LNPSELAFGAVVVVVLVGLAVFFGWQQLRTLRSLPGQPDLDLEDRIYLRRQVARRLVCSVLMLILAGLLTGSYFLEGPLQQVQQERAEEIARGQDPPVQPGHKTFLQQLTAYWITILLVLMVLLFLVAADVWAIARFGQRHRRQLRADLQETLAREVAKLRQRHNGQQDQ